MNKRFNSIVVVFINEKLTLQMIIGILRGLLSSEIPFAVEFRIRFSRIYLDMDE